MATLVRLQKSRFISLYLTGCAVVNVHVKISMACSFVSHLIYLVPEKIDQVEKCGSVKNKESLMRTQVVFLGNTCSRFYLTWGLRLDHGIYFFSSPLTTH